MTARTPDEPYYMWRRASACLPREIEAVRLAPCQATPSNPYDCRRHLSGIAGTDTNARAATSIGFRMGVLVYEGLYQTVDVWRTGAARLWSGQSLLQFEARQACVFPCESYCVRLKRQVTLRLLSEGFDGSLPQFSCKNWVFRPCPLTAHLPYSPFWTQWRMRTKNGNPCR